MGRKLNEIRRKISRLRAEMLSLQEDMRALVNLGLDCSEPSIRLMAMRVAMVDLIRQRNAMGGMEVCPNIAERLKQNHRMAGPSHVRQGKARPEPGQRALANLGHACSEPSIRLMAMRVAMVDLIRQRNAMGGMEVCPNIAERLKQNHRMAAPSHVRQGKARPKPGSRPERDRSERKHS